MTRLAKPLAVTLLLAWFLSPVHAGSRELRTVEAAADAVKALSDLPFKSIPPCLMQDAQAVVVLPDVLKAGFVLGGRFGRGVFLVRQPDGCWSNPVFITLAGGGIGWQVGIQSTDLILVFKTRNSLDRLLKGKGKLTLGGDVAVAAGPVGRQAEAATDAQLKAEIWSYSRSRGLFAGVSVEGAALLVDCEADETFYGLRGGLPADVLALRIDRPVAALECLKAELARLAMPAGPPAILLPPATPPPPVAPPPPPPPPGKP
jgi:lipid-binding SYLF domain-containing protein